jgi:hypothetical protein
MSWVVGGDADTRLDYFLSPPIFSPVLPQSPRWLQASLEWLHRQFDTHVSGTHKAARGKEDIDTVLVASSSWMESWEDGRGAGTGLRVERSSRPRPSSLVTSQD